MAKQHPEKTAQEETADPMPPGLSQEQRIEKLKDRLAELTDGEMTLLEYDAGQSDPAFTEQYLENVLAIEEAGWTVPAERLKEGGLELPPPDELDDEALSKKLREVIQAMALHNVYLTRTDHLNDRELYTELVEDVLQEELLMGPTTPVQGFNNFIDMLGSGSEKDAYLMLKYYADKRFRKLWLKDFPDYDMPAREKPPYDRDRFLPQPDWTPDMDDDEPFM